MMRLVPNWIKGALFCRYGALGAAMVGVALTVAFVAALGSFLTASNAQMTRRAIRDVPVDWQIQLAPGVDREALKSQVARTVSPAVLEQVAYAKVDGFRARTGGTVQTTGPGKALGVGPQYFSHFPREIRPLLGSATGVLLAQQTAANLHAKIGDSVQILRVGLPPVRVPVDGIVDLPNADSLFQAVGVPAGIAPQAPPDNVIILPNARWREIFKPQMAVRPDSVRIQFHVRLRRNLPGDPKAAYAVVMRQAKHLEARLAGSGIIGNNLASRLLSVSADALYAHVLFLFLGLPGVILVVMLTVFITGAGGQRRAREQALLRMRGATVSQILHLEAAEALLIGVGGLLLGSVLTAAFCLLLGIRMQQLRNPLALDWMAFASVGGIALALCVKLVPAWVRARKTSVAAARACIRPTRVPLWQRAWLDVAILILGMAEFWRTASSGYQVVLAPEGVAATAVNYEAFVAPVCLWTGGFLFCYRLIQRLLQHSRRLLAKLLFPLAGSLSDLVSSSLIRQPGFLTRGIVLVALAISFAVSIATFDATYTGQSRVDAELTNGSDVTIAGSTPAPPGAKLAVLRAIPGVSAAQSMQHRFAYVGNDLQDIYGIDPRHIGEATRMSNAFFGGGNARAALNALAKVPDGVLVSEETVRDFQLNPGDTLNLRVQFAGDHQYHAVPFHFVGVVREFPTAPTDSFLVANSAYLAAQTGTAAAETVLLRVHGDPTAVAKQARALVSDLPGAKVSDLGSVQRAISSSLTAIDLRGLTTLELAFAILMVTAATGLILGLGLAARRRMFAILSGLGAIHRQLSAFFWSESLLILAGGTLIGAGFGVGVTLVLVKMLTGVFDPPPESLTFPGEYLALLAAAAVASTVLAVMVVKTYARRGIVESLRGL